jgi:hypothetical protein
LGVAQHLSIFLPPIILTRPGLYLETRFRRNKNSPKIIKNSLKVLEVKMSVRFYYFF